MAKRFTDTEKFKDIWYRKLSPVQKCVWEFLLAECNHAGIIELDLEFASFVIGQTVTDEDLIPFQNKLQHLEKDLYFIPNFIEFQYGKLSKLSKPHIPVIKLLEKFNIPFDLIDENGLDSNQIRQRLTNKAKEKIFVRDKYECQYCGSHEDLEVDHIVPISKGGTNADSNLITACHRCNHLKKDYDLEDFINKYKNEISFLERVSKILYTLKEKEKEKDKEKEIKKVNIKFIKPTLEEIKSYCYERKNNINPEQFFDFYESNGWQVGKTKMKDWQAAVRTWERNTKGKIENESNNLYPSVERTNRVIAEQKEYAKLVEQNPTNLEEIKQKLTFKRG